MKINDRNEGQDWLIYRSILPPFKEKISPLR